MSLAPSNNKFDAFLRVTQSPFSDCRYILASAPDRDEAARRCLEAAAREGWTPPTWWQWWRRKDSYAPKVQPYLGL